jgi:hypothetical protein
MISNEVLSDQLFTWSDTNDTEIDCGPEKTAPVPPPPTAPTDRHPPRLTHRTLQTLRQARMQMRQGSRSWPQVLPVCKLSPFAPPNGLRTAGVSRPDQKVSCQLSTCSRDPGGGLRDQPRATPPARSALRNHDERNVFLAHRIHRSGIGGRPPRQYARDLARRPSGLLDNRGGDR